MIARNWLSRGRLSPIGLDVGARVCKAVQVKTSPGSGTATVVATAVMPRPDPDAAFGEGDLARLLPLLVRRGFSGRDVILAAPTGLLESDMLELPARSSGAPVDELAVAEIGRTARLAAGSYEAACWDVPVSRGGPGAGTSVLAVALRHVDAETLIAPFDAAGYRVRAIDTPGWAIARVRDREVSHGSAPAGTGETLLAVLDLGWQRGAVTLLAGGDVLYHRVLHECGVGPLYRQLGNRHGISDEAADCLLCDGAADLPAAGPVVGAVVDAYVGQVAEELGASLAFARHRYSGRRVSDVWLVGGGAKVKRLAEGLAAAVRLPVAAMGIPRFLSFAADQLGEAGWPQLAPAAGLALHPEGAR